MMGTPSNTAITAMADDLRQRADTIDGWQSDETPAPQRPAEPVVVVTPGTAGSGKVTYSWSQPPGGETSRWVHGVVEDGVPDATDTLIPNTVTVSSLAMGVPLTVYVRAEGPGGTSATAVSVTLPPTPPGPQPPGSFDALRAYKTSVGPQSTAGYRTVSGRMDVRTGDTVENVILNGYLNFLGRPKVIRNMVITTTSAWATMYGWNYGCDLMENVTITGGVDACMQMINTKARNIRLLCAKGADGIKIKSGLDLEHFFIQMQPASPPVEHADGGQSMDGSNIRIVDGLIAARSQVTSGLMMASDPGRLSNVLVEWVLVTLPPGERANIPFYFWKSSGGAGGTNIVGRDLGADRGGGWNSGPAYNTIGASLTRVGWT